MTNISEQLLRQRVRNNIIEYLEVASSAEEQRKYERDLIAGKAPGLVPQEIICQWGDGFNRDRLEWYCLPVFSKEENVAIRDFDILLMSFCKKTPDPLPWTIEDLIGTEPWTELMSGAACALAIFEKRGKFSSETEVDFVT